MSVRNFWIQFDSPTDTYYAGRTVTGRVNLKLDKNIKIRGLKVKCVGFAHVSWKEKVSHRHEKEEEKEKKEEEPETMEIYSADEEYFSKTFYLIGSDSSNITVPAGKHSYIFSVELPENLPTSFEGKYGHLRYFMNATLDSPRKLNEEASSLFQVLSPLNLNKLKTAKAPVKRETSKNFCCLWCKSGPLTLVLWVPQTGFVAGEEIPLTVEVDNASNVKVEAVEVTLKKVENYTAYSPMFSEKFIEKEFINKTLGEVEVNGSKTFTKAIRFPTVPFINLKSCSVIDVKFYLQVTARASRACATNLSEKIKLTMGTVAIGSSKKTNNFSFLNPNSGVQSSAPPCMPPAPGFYPDGAFSLHTEQNYSTHTPNSGVPTPPIDHSTPYPLPVYPDIKINTSYSKGSTVYETAPIID